MDGSDQLVRAELVRTVVEECWSDEPGVARLGALVAPDYVHHAVVGDWTFAEFAAGLAWVETQFVNRSYVAEHVLVDGDRVAAYVRWTATRVSDGSQVDGRGAYHCRVAEGLVAEDWDVFFPMS
jgi:ketosteroid isomerase-like protein